MMAITPDNHERLMKACDALCAALTTLQGLAADLTEKKEGDPKDCVAIIRARNSTAEAVEILMKGFF